MDLQQIRAYLEENKGNSDVQAFVSELNPVTLDRVKGLAETDEGIKGWLGSIRDQHFSKSLETWKANNLEDLVNQKVSELHPPETQEQIRIKQLEDKLAAAEAKEKRDILKAKALEVATEKGMPIKLVDYLIGEDEEKTLANLTMLEETFEPFINQKVEDRWKSTGRDFKKGGTNEASTAASIAEMMNSQQQATKNSAWD